MKIACYGIMGCHTETVILDFFSLKSSLDFDIIYLTTLSDVAMSVKNGIADFAVMPIKNSIAGPVIGALDIIKDNDLVILEDFWVDIIHSLLAKPGVKLEQIKEILSHYQGLWQCKTYLDSLPNCPKLTKFDDTASAAKFVSESQDTTLAAVAHARCAEVYNLNILASNIQDCKKNKTHFVVLGKQGASLFG